MPIDINLLRVDAGKCSKTIHHQTEKSSLLINILCL